MELGAAEQSKLIANEVSSQITKLSVEHAAREGYWEKREVRSSEAITKLQDQVMLLDRQRVALRAKVDKAKATKVVAKNQAKAAAEKLKSKFALHCSFRCLKS